MKSIIRIVLVTSLAILIQCSSQKNNLNFTTLNSSYLISYIKDNSTLYTFDTKTQNSLFIHADNHIAAPSWSPDKDKIIYYTTSGQNYQINIYDLNNLKTIHSENVGHFDSFKNILKATWYDTINVVYCDAIGIKFLNIKNDSTQRLIKHNKILDYNLCSNKKLVFVSDDSLFVKKNVFDQNTDFILKLGYVKIYCLSSSADGNQVLISHDDGIDQIDLNDKSCKMIYSSDKEIYWVDWIGPNDLIFLEGKPAHQYGFDSRRTYFLVTFNPSAGINFGLKTSGQDYRVKSSGYFYIKTISLKSGELSVKNLFRSTGNVYSVNPVLSPDRKLLAFISNSRNTVRKTFVLSVNDGRLSQIEDDGICSYPIFID